MKYSFDIDEKSLFRGIKNDYSKGQSATISTPLNQSHDKEKWRTPIYDFLNAYPSEKIEAIPEVLKNRCLSSTTSKAKCKLVYFNVFTKFSVDGIPFDCDSSFAMYVKEEISDMITKRDGIEVPNTHLGRKKLHYPVSFCYADEKYCINNKKVLEKIIEVNGGFAYIVEGFDFDVETNVLNFRTVMVGPNGVLLSNVFKRKKGVGNKLLIKEYLKDLDLPLGAEKEISLEEGNAFVLTLKKIEESKRRNGLLGEEYVYENLNKILKCKYVEKCVHVSKLYPQSPYDIECFMEGKKTYIEVKSTISDKKIFYMSRGERKFMDKYQNNYILILVTKVKLAKKGISVYNRGDIMNKSIMEQELQGIKFIVK